MVNQMRRLRRGVGGGLKVAGQVIKKQNAPQSALQFEVRSFGLGADVHKEMRVLQVREEQSAR